MKNMITIFSFGPLLTVHSIILSICVSAWDYPLLFDPYTSMIYVEPQSNPKNTQYFTYPVFAACPAKSNDEKKMNKTQSKDHKALFVRRFYARAGMMNKLVLCDSSFELAVATIPESSPMHIEFGYEVYIEKSVIPENVGRIKTTLYQSLKPISGDQNSVEHPFLAETIQLDFVWLEKITVQFDTYFWKLKSVQYSIRRSADRINVECDNDNLGKQFYAEHSKNLEEMYSTTENIEKYNLLMPYHFQSSPFSAVSCSNLTSIPIWYNAIKNLLNYTEKFLIAISEIASNELIVTSGGIQTLSIPYKDPNTDETKSQRIYLDKAKAKFPVPRIIYKIVKYQPYNCKDIDDLCWFDMVIVIHNEPKITQEKLCPDQCTKLGWNSIQYLSTTDKSKETKSELIYCCQLDENLKKTLGYKLDYERGDLDLKNFPVGNKNRKIIVFKNMQQEFEKKMKELFE